MDCFTPDFFFLRYFTRNEGNEIKYSTEQNKCKEKAAHYYHHHHGMPSTKLSILQGGKCPLRDLPKQCALRMELEKAVASAENNQTAACRDQQQDSSDDDFAARISSFQQCRLRKTFPLHRRISKQRQQAWKTAIPEESDHVPSDKK